MIYLTGDVHLNAQGNWEQQEAGQDVDNSVRYLEILKKYKVKSTIFVNGALCDKEPEKVKMLMDYDIELGGHTYNNFGSMHPFKSYIFRKLWKCIYGPAGYQRRDIKKTRKALEKLGIKMTSWRTHSFGSNNNTYQILAEEGVKFVSDFLGKTKPFEKSGITHLPINIPVDVVTVAYGLWRPENPDPFASCAKGRIEPEEWLEIVKKRIKDNERRKIDSILLLHPTTMKAMDNFRIFEEIAGFIAKYKTGKISEFKFQKI